MIRRAKRCIRHRLPSRRRPRVRVGRSAGPQSVDAHGALPEPAPAFLRASPQACMRKAETIDRRLTGWFASCSSIMRSAIFARRKARCAWWTALELNDSSAPASALSMLDGCYRTVRGILDRGTDQVQSDDEVRTVRRPIGAFLRGPAAFARSLLQAH